MGTADQVWHTTSGEPPAQGHIQGHSLSFALRLLQFPQASGVAGQVLALFPSEP